MGDHAVSDGYGQSSKGRAAIAAAGTSRAGQGRVGFLDSFRAIAAGAVVVQHAFSASSIQVLRNLTEFSPGVFGVVLFFLVSGFAIPLSIGARFDPRSFVVRRLFRIFPATLAATALWFVLSASGTINDAVLRHASSGDWIANLLLIPDYVGAPSFLGVTWTLPLEFTWYLLFALCRLRFHQSAALILELGAPAAMLLLELLSVALDQRIPLGRIGMLYAAIIGYQAYRYHVGAIPWSRFVWSGSVFLAVMALGNYIAFGLFHHPTITLNQSLYPWIAAPLLFALGLWNPRRRLDPLLDNKALAWLGTVSFSTYLVHPMAISAVEGRLQGIAALVVLTLLTLLLSAAGYYMVERPGMEIGRRLAHRRRQLPRVIAETL